MICCIDVQYSHDSAVTALVAFENWESALTSYSGVFRRSGIAEYEPGSFYKRELPCILDALTQTSLTFSTICIDGYVWLDNGIKPGLGAHLYDALERRCPIIGIAKTKFTSGLPIEVLRGASRQPLYVTAAGIDIRTAADLVKSMHGAHRLPTMVKQADTMARSGLSSN